jgi:hypothetical protein
MGTCRRLSTTDDDWVVARLPFVEEATDDRPART